MVNEIGKTLTDVRYAPELSKTLILLSTLDSDYMTGRWI